MISYVLFFPSEYIILIFRFFFLAIQGAYRQWCSLLFESATSYCGLWFCGSTHKYRTVNIWVQSSMCITYIVLAYAIPIGKKIAIIINLEMIEREEDINKIYIENWNTFAFFRSFHMKLMWYTNIKQWPASEYVKPASIYRNSFVYTAKQNKATKNTML